MNVSTPIMIAMFVLVVALSNCAKKDEATTSTGAPSPVGTWKTGCLNKGANGEIQQLKMGEDLSFNYTTSVYTGSTTCAVAPTGGENISGTYKVGSASAVVTSAYDLDLIGITGCDPMQTVYKIDSTNLYIGEDDGSGNYSGCPGKTRHNKMGTDAFVKQ